jgi:hypothetical protein
MSMTLEFLSRADDALKLIENDPQQAAVILRGIRRTEYHKTQKLRPFDKFLSN